MTKIKIEKPDEEKLKSLGVYNWPIWEKEISRFDWYYGETEICYLLEGRVIVELPDGSQVEIKAGDLVTFPKGLSCIWDIKEPVRKHYSFSEE
ncbi:MAG: cupin domain-containing protein [Caldimicrobium sp.]